MPVLNIWAPASGEITSWSRRFAFWGGALIWIKHRHFLFCGQTHNPCVLERTARPLSWLLGLKRDPKGSRVPQSAEKEQRMLHGGDRLVRGVLGVQPPLTLASRSLLPCDLTI